MINNAGPFGCGGMTDCQRCGARMSHNDETTKLTEYTCPRCHNTQIVWKPARRATA